MKKQVIIIICAFLIGVFIGMTFRKEYVFYGDFGRYAVINHMTGEVKHFEFRNGKNVPRSR